MTQEEKDFDKFVEYELMPEKEGELMKTKVEYSEIKTKRPGITHCMLKTTIGISELHVSYSTNNMDKIREFKNAFDDMNTMIQNEGRTE